MPRSPRATITPSVSLRISSKFATPCSFSIFTMILMLAPSGPKTVRMSRTSWPRRINEANTISTPFLTPNKRSCLSFSERAGRSTSVLGRFTPFRDEMFPLFKARTRTLVPSIESTRRERIPKRFLRTGYSRKSFESLPSSTYISFPGVVTFGRLAWKWIQRWYSQRNKRMATHIIQPHHLVIAYLAVFWICRDDEFMICFNRPLMMKRKTTRCQKDSLGTKNRGLHLRHFWLHPCESRGLSVGVRNVSGMSDLKRTTTGDVLCREQWRQDVHRDLLK